LSGETVAILSRHASAGSLHWQQAGAGRAGQSGSICRYVRTLHWRDELRPARAASSTEPCALRSVEANCGLSASCSCCAVWPLLCAMSHDGRLPLQRPGFVACSHVHPVPCHLGHHNTHTVASGRCLHESVLGLQVHLALARRECIVTHRGRAMGETHEHLFQIKPGMVSSDKIWKHETASLLSQTSWQCASSKARHNHALGHLIIQNSSKTSDKMRKNSFKQFHFEPTH
jgi:hypothetical protein